MRNTMFSYSSKAQEVNEEIISGKNQSPTFL
jgi:hypothetical protein